MPVDRSRFTGSESSAALRLAETARRRCSDGCATRHLPATRRRWHRWCQQARQALNASLEITDPQVEVDRVLEAKDRVVEVAAKNTNRTGRDRC
jgi:hypothetical protein